MWAEREWRERESGGNEQRERERERERERGRGGRERERGDKKGGFIDAQNINSPLLNKT